MWYHHGFHVSDKCTEVVVSVHVRRATRQELFSCLTLEEENLLLLCEDAEYYQDKTGFSYSVVLAGIHRPKPKSLGIWGFRRHGSQTFGHTFSSDSPGPWD